MRGYAARLLLFASLLAMAAPVASEERAPLGLPPVPVPADNPQTEGKVNLGKDLFEDRRFSADGTISCAHCHGPARAFTDGLPVSRGIGGQTGTRNAPTVVNAAFYTSQFWDGRRPSLEAQAKDPFLNPIEHGLPSHDSIVRVIREDPEYPDRFRRVFGIEPTEITIDHVVKAIAAFERTMVSGDSPFDRYLYGREATAMSESAIRGLDVFRNKGRCVSCHEIGPASATFTDNEFHNLGVGFGRIADRMFEIADAYRAMVEAGKSVDETVLTSAEVSELGRFTVTLHPADIGRFKTSTLRNIAVTPPYMHDGSHATLKEVVEFYDEGGHDNPLLDGGIRPLNLTEGEEADLVEFLRALTSPEYAEAPVARVSGR